MKLNEKEIVEPESLKDYYVSMRDKRLIDMPNVVIIDEPDRYVVVKNKWKYTKDITECRDITGKCFNLRDISFLYVKATEFLDGGVNIEDVNVENIVIKL